jgi:DNA-binding GntR family transcriptional regulator
MKGELSAEQAKGLLAVFGDPNKVTWTLPEQIANRLSEDIIRGVFVPGQPLMEVMLAEAYFRVSRGPVREALRILEKEGLVEIRPRRGAIVAEHSASDVEQVFKVRAVLYGFVSSELAAGCDEETLKKLKLGTAALAAAVKKQDVDVFLAELYRLSMYLPEFSGNSYAKQIIVSLGRQTLATTRKVMMINENCQLWMENWTKVVKAIELGDPRAAEEAGRKLVHDVYDATVKILKDNQSPA